MGGRGSGSGLKNNPYIHSSVSYLENLENDLETRIQQTARMASISTAGKGPALTRRIKAANTRLAKLRDQQAQVHAALVRNRKRRGNSTPF